MSSVTVVIPYRPEPERDPVFSWVRDRYETAGWRVRVGTCPSGPWSKGAAVADGLTQCPAGWVVIADADCWCDHLDAAVDVTMSVGRWSVPHGEVRRLDAASTRDVLAGGYPGGDLEEPAYRGVVGGGLVCLPTGLAADVPMDPRFAGWGGEDHAWGYALTAVAGRPWRPNRGEAPLWHLWHPHPPRDNRVVGNAANEALRARYQRARRSPEQTRRLLAEIGG